MFDISRIFENSGEQMDISCEMSSESTRGLKGIAFVRPASLSGKVANRAGIVTLSYTASGTITTQCDRCLKDVVRDFEYGFEHVVVRSVQHDNDEYIIAEDGMLDMDSAALDDVLLELPTKNLCSDDCKGLCPVCGADLNVTKCEHI
ncbi:MAG: DUF177 domain-containing protein [Oscillospiraceae bacterium]|nr:DUF177 domain-containing protein [Oscillospiraceae bacterium]MBQ8979057.1 DUF177 domain-containing protein [Oscillospiraceae bacterium]